MKHEQRTLPTQDGTMTANAYRITFRGKIMKGWDPETVKEGVARLFKLNPANEQHLQKLNRLFSGDTVIIKEGLSQESAQAYIDALTKVGAEAYIKIKVGPPDGIEERRHSARRKQGDRRAVRRTSAIVPDRRNNKGRRDSDPKD